MGQKHSHSSGQHKTTKTKKEVLLTREYSLPSVASAEETTKSDMSCSSSSDCYDACYPHNGSCGFVVLDTNGKLLNSIEKSLLAGHEVKTT
jgi:hypothetical protein